MPDYLPATRLDSGFEIKVDADGLRIDDAYYATRVSTETTRALYVALGEYLTAHDGIDEE